MHCWPVFYACVANYFMGAGARDGKKTEDSAWMCSEGGPEGRLKAGDRGLHRSTAAASQMRTALLTTRGPGGTGTTCFLFTEIKDQGSPHEKDDGKAQSRKKKHHNCSLRLSFTTKLATIRSPCLGFCKFSRQNRQSGYFPAPHRDCRASPAPIRASSADRRHSNRCPRAPGDP